jgi:predicted MFS family arabinose efflux permease
VIRLSEGNFVGNLADVAQGLPISTSITSVTLTIFAFGSAVT